MVNKKSGIVDVLVYVSIESSYENAESMLLKSGREIVLITDQNRHLLGYLTWRDLLEARHNGEKVIHAYRSDHMVLSEDDDIPYGRIPEGSLFVYCNSQGDLTRFETRNELQSRLASTRLTYLHQAVEHARMGFLAIDVQGRITVLNKRSREIAELDGDFSAYYLQPFTDIYDDHTLMRALIDEKEQLNQVEFLKDSKLLINRAPVYEDNGKLIGAVSVYEEQTRLELMSEQLENVINLHLELKTIVDSIYDELLVVDKNGTILRVNEKDSYHFWGTEKVELIGKNIFEIEEKGYFKPSVTQLVLEKKKKTSIIQENKAGRKIVAIGNPILNENGEVEKIIIAYRDIDEILQLKVELAEAKIESQNYRQEIEILKSSPVLKRPLIYKADKMRKLLAQVEKVAKVDSTVLIYGESGVGKEVIAENIHHLSKRSEHPFIKVNCGAIPDSLLESELFGYDKGAFTGALNKGKTGMFELADKGTLFLDEIGEINIALQVKLLQAIQDRKIMRVGGSKPIPVDIKIIAATNKNLEEMVEQKTFREDLYYRLAVIPLYVPSLSERTEDIESIAFYFLDFFNSKYGADKHFSEDALEILKIYHWPGNVRELQNVVERVVVTVSETLITLKDLEFLSRKKGKDKEKEKEKEKDNDHDQPVSVHSILPLKEMIALAEKQLLLMAIHKYSTTTDIARALDISQPTAWRKIQEIRAK